MKQPKRGGALAALEIAAGNAPKTLDLPVDLVRADPNQPRTEFGGDEDTALTETISEVGIAQPLVVRPDPEGSGYLILAGERRYRAAVVAGVATVPCFVRENISPADVPVLQLVENLQRKDLKPLEIARGLAEALRLNSDLSQAALGKKIGKDGAYVNQHLALLDPNKTPPDAQEALDRGLLRDRETTRQFVQLPADRRESLSRQAAETNVPISRAQVERARSEKASPAPAPSTPRTPAAPQSATAAPDPTSVAPRRGRPAAPRPVRYHIPLTWEQIQRFFAICGQPVPPSPDGLDVIPELHKALDKADLPT